MYQQFVEEFIRNGKIKEMMLFLRVIYFVSLTKPTSKELYGVVPRYRRMRKALQMSEEDIGQIFQITYIADIDMTLNDALKDKSKVLPSACEKIGEVLQPYLYLA